MVSGALLHQAALKIASNAPADQLGNSINCDIGTVPDLADVWVFASADIIELHMVLSLGVLFDVTDDPLPELVGLKGMLIILLFVPLPILLCH